MEDSQFACTQCGADLKFEPGTHQIVCPYCNHSNEIETGKDATGEQDYLQILAELKAQQETYEVATVACPSCGGTTQMDAHVETTECAFCGTSIRRAEENQRLIKPQSILPFNVTKSESFQAYKTWLKKLWFAPNKLKKFAHGESALQGIYLPHWTYDSITHTRYTGQRGEYYYVNERYTATDSEGNTVTKTKRVQKTRWYPASGQVSNSFDDILVVASESLPHKYVAQLEPWDLPALVSFDDSYTAGMKTESYTIDVEQGFEHAKNMMEPSIKDSIRRDIGGDTQRIHHFSVVYDAVSFKHILLPVWISAYRFKNKVYRFLVNARTGEVRGERPWSAVKIALAVISGLLLIGGIAYYVAQNQ